MVWIALGGVVATNGIALLAVVIKRARRDQMIEDELKTMHRDLARGSNRFQRLEEKLDENTKDLREDMKEIAKVLAKVETSVAVLAATAKKNGK